MRDEVRPGYRLTTKINYMKANLRKIRKKRIYAEDLKEIVSIFESGKLSVLQIEKLYLVTHY